MKRSIALITLALLTGSLYAATPKEDVLAAAKKLGDAGNYSWKTTPAAPAGGGGGGGGRRGGFGGGPSEGKIDKDGTAVIATTQGENVTHAVLKGEKGAIETQDGWQSLAELTANAQGGGGGRRGGFGALRFRNFKAPAAEAADLVGKAKELKSADGAISGDLTEEGAKSLMAFGGRGGGAGPEIAGAKGSVKFWVKDGMLAKYELKVQGTMSFNGNDIAIDRTTTTEISAVGSTKVEVPAEAKKKL